MGPPFYFSTFIKLPLNINILDGLFHLKAIIGDIFIIQFSLYSPSTIKKDESDLTNLISKTQNHRFMTKLYNACLSNTWKKISSTIKKTGQNTLPMKFLQNGSKDEASRLYINDMSQP